MFDKANAKIFFFISCGLTLYFSFLFFNFYVLKSDFVLIGVFQELLTIPLLLAQLFLLGVTLNNWRKDGFRLIGYSFWSFIMLLLMSTIMVLASVFKW